MIYQKWSENLVGFGAYDLPETKNLVEFGVNGLEFIKTESSR